VDHFPAGDRGFDLLALVARNLQHGAVAPGMDPGVAPDVKIEQVMARHVPEIGALHLEFARTGPPPCEHRREVEVANAKSPVTQRVLSDPARSRPLVLQTSKRAGRSRRSSKNR